jgi:2-keto-3-deoxy-L-rhamnonate aldolase RhmA
VLAREPLYGAFVNLSSSVTAEIMGLAGFDWLVIDLEHGIAGEREALVQLQAIAHTGAAGIVRVAALERVRILHALDSGATGVLVPQVESPDEARFAVECCRYAGVRGVARYNRSWRWGSAVEPLSAVDARVLCCIQIEREAALDQVDEIASIDGVDVVFVGPGDLGHSLGIAGPPDNPELRAGGCRGRGGRTSRQGRRRADRHARAGGALSRAGLHVRRMLVGQRPLDAERQRDRQGSPRVRLAPSAGANLEDRLELDRSVLRQRRDADRRAGVGARLAEHLVEDLRRGVRNQGLLGEVRGARDEYRDLHHAPHRVERTEGGLSGEQRVDRRLTRARPSLLH